MASGGGGGATDDGQATVAYAVYDAKVRQRCIGLMVNEEELSAFSHSIGVMRRTQAMLGRLGGELEQGKELRLPNGTALGVWSMVRPEDDAALPTDFDSQFVQIRLDLAGAASGVRLDGDWERRVKCGKLLAEIVAAHVAFNRANGTSYEVVFELDCARFGGREMKGVPIIGSTAKTEVVVRMLRLLEQQEDVDMPKFYRAEDQGPPVGGGGGGGDNGRFRPLHPAHIRVGAGAWSQPWKDLDELSYKFPAVVIGLDPTEYEDAMGSGVPIGLLRAELGEVSLVQTYSVRGYDNTRRVLLSCEVAAARRVRQRLDDCTSMAVNGRAIIVSGEVVSIVRTRALKAVYTGPIHRLEVRDGGGGSAGLKKQMEKMSDQLRDVKARAEEQRLEAARMASELSGARTEMQQLAAQTSSARKEAAGSAEQLRAAQENLATVQGNLARQTAAAQERLQELSGAAQAGLARAETAEALAAHRHAENQAAQQQIYELNSRMALFMADIVAGRDPTAKLQRTVQYTAPADGGVEVDEATKALTVAQSSDGDSELSSYDSEGDAGEGGGGGGGGGGGDGGGNDAAAAAAAATTAAAVAREGEAGGGVPPLPPPL